MNYVANSVLEYDISEMNSHIFNSKKYTNSICFLCNIFPGQITVFRIDVIIGTQCRFLSNLFLSHAFRKNSAEHEELQRAPLIRWLTRSWYFDIEQDAISEKERRSERVATI